jgi:NAD-dependent deacetylase
MTGGMSATPDSWDQRLKSAVKIIQESRYAVALTGAGISTPSGIPDFRSPDSGLWERFDPFEVASLDVFRYHPEKFYNWMRPLAQNIRLALPNPAHLALVRLQKAGILKTIITQNIDCLHQRAGAQNVLEVHGSLQTLTCVSCYRQREAGDYIEAYTERGEIPHCPSCNCYLKPDVVLFGEQLPARTWLKAKEGINRCDVLIVAGSSLEVLPVAGLPMRAIENGARLIIINQSETYIDPRADVVISEDVATTLPRIVQEVLGD